MRAICVYLLASISFVAPALAQSGVGVGLGIGSGTATSNSSAGNATSTATGGQASSAAQGGNSGVTFNNNGNPAFTRSDQTLDQTVTQRGGTSSVSRQTGGLRNVPATFAPSLTAAGLETCLGSVSGGGSGMGFGVSFGTTIVDRGCDARLDSRTLWNMGLKRAALARLCIKDEIRQSLPECADYLPQSAQPGLPVAAVAVGAPHLEPRFEAPVPVRGQRTLVVERASGRERACDDFDGRRCLRWSR